MKLKEIEIFDFKSIRHEKISFGQNQMCLVGINESGKSSILEAISYLNILDKSYTKKLLNKKSSRGPNGNPMICGLFEVTKSELKVLHEWLTENKDTSINTNKGNWYIYLKRWGNGIQNIAMYLSDLADTNLDLLELFNHEKSLFLDKFFNSIYPFIEIYKNENLLIEPATIEELEGTDNKFETFRRLMHIGKCHDFQIFDTDDMNEITIVLQDVENNLNEIFKKHYKQDESIKIHLTGFNSKLTVVIQDSSTKTFSIDERSPGFQYYFAFLINKLYLNSIYGDKDVVYLLDEPGNNLHPKGAKDLLRSFTDMSTKNQIIYTTHNPFLAIRNDMDSLVFVKKDPSNGTKINRKPFLNKYQVLRQELGILLNDSFIIGDINIIVEGNTEKLAFHRLFQEEAFSEMQWLNIYNADGVSNVTQALNYLGRNNLNLSGIIVMDSDEQARQERQKKFFKAGISHSNWGCIEINSIFDDRLDRTFEDLFPQEIYIAAFNDYCNSIKNLGVFSTEYKNYTYQSKIATPLINTLEEHFYSFVEEKEKKNKSITKQDVIRILLDKTDKMQAEEKSTVLLNVTKLIHRMMGEIKKLPVYANN